MGVFDIFKKKEPMRTATTVLRIAGIRYFENNAKRFIGKQEEQTFNCVVAKNPRGHNAYTKYIITINNKPIGYVSEDGVPFVDQNIKTIVDSRAVLMQTQLGNISGDLHIIHGIK